mmetsp:Transcript_27326/g.55847  ORF Transcript_27326/g.55847 Transcript_27326/m.55847 type:complete len:588 (-) Transcript_27326:47-1810(-)
MLTRASLVYFSILCAAKLITGDERTQRYTDGEPVTLWVNKIGPYENPQETYSYYTLPFCKVNPEKWDTRWAGLGETLEGNSLVKSDYIINFKKNIPEPVVVCSSQIDEEALDMFDYAVENHYWYNLVLDELPIWAMVGETRTNSSSSVGEVLVYTHKRFSIAHNGDRVIEVNLTNENPMPLTLNSKLAFSYDVSWFETDKKFSHRFNRYLDQDFFEHQIHWFSIFNSFMMVIFLVGLVGLILMRTLKSDYSKYSKQFDEEDAIVDAPEDSGWKQVQGDVFRFPPYLPLFCGLVGTGVQLIMMVYCTSILSIVGTLYIGRGSVSTTAVVVYALSSFVGGFVSGRFYAQSKGNAWIKTMLVTAAGFTGIFVLVGGSLNMVAIAYNSLAAIPIGTMMVLLLIWALVSCPLVLFGTIVGRNMTTPYQPPTRISAIPRQIPEKRWYLQSAVLLPLGGLLPFGSIFIEMYFIFTSFWNYKFYYVYGFVLLVFSILLVVTSCVSIVITYFLLNAEDYRWPWTAFLSAASISLYAFTYAIYYFFAKTKMYGLFQTAFYFGQTLLLCLGLGIVCGAIGYLGARAFVWRIFRSVKSD